MNRYCPSCHFHWAWKLKDGRFKCRQCGKRYTFRSIWQSSHLSERTKLSLLHDFSTGSMAVHPSGTRPSRMRFLQLTRMTIAYHEHYGEPFQGIMASTSGSASPTPGSDPIYMVLGMRQNDAHIRVFPISGPDGQRLVSLVQTTSPSGGLYYTADRHAFGLLPVQDGVVVAHRMPDIRPSTSDSPEAFWKEIHRWIVRYRKISLRWFHLFVGEMSLRFHHREEDLFPIILAWVKQTPMHEIRNM